jgi:hypothetical protein
VSEDYAALRNNTARRPAEHQPPHRRAMKWTALEPLVLMVAPLAPHRRGTVKRLGQDIAGARAFPGGGPAVPGWRTRPSIR